MKIKDYKSREQIYLKSPNRAHHKSYMDRIIECKDEWEIMEHYVKFAGKHGLIMTGGSDCHQKPILMGTPDIPGWVANQFNRRKEP